MKKLLLLLAVTLSGVLSYAQLLTWNPPFPTDQTSGLAITMDAAKGNQGLMNYTPTTDVYVHTGVITSASTSSSDWRYVRNFGAANPFNTPVPQLQAAYIGSNKWQYTIAGDVRSFYGVPAGEQILKIAILFRSGNGNRVQRNSDGGDMYVPIYSNDLAVRIEQPAREPRFVPVPEQQNWVIGTVFNITGLASQPSALKLYHNNILVATSAASATTISGSSTVTALGNQQIIIEAINGSITRYDTVNVFVSPSSSPVAALPPGLRDGINYESDNTAATLVLHAPGKNKAFVIGEFNGWASNLSYIMNKTPDGKKFWIRLTGLVPGTEYGFQYRVDDTLKIADPYTQKVLDPWNDQFISATTYPNLKPYPAGQTGIVSVLQTAEPIYTWSVPAFNRPDKRGLVIYELLLRDFIAAHDWKTLKDTLSYLKGLGVNAIELLPFNEFEGNSSWGYNPDFYFAPDKYYGPKNTLKQFIDSAHKNGMAVIMDVALNHSFGLSPMVQLYWDAANNRPAANNPWYNPEARHPFNVGFDFNHESLDTRYFTSRVVEHWLQEYKIDGFRFDLSKGFTQVNNPTNVGAWGAYDASRVAIWKRYYDTTQLKSPGSYAILEHFADNKEEIELADYGMLLWGNMNHSYNEATMGWLPTSNFEGGIHSVRGWSKPHLITYAESHDEERLMYRNINFGNNSNPAHNTRDTTVALKRMELAGVFLFTIPGPKMIWQFGELGYDYSINYCQNGTINPNCRVDPKPIRWDYRQQARRNTLYDVYGKLIKLRFHQWYKEAFISGTIERNLGGAFKWLKVSSGDTSHLMVVGNFDVNATSGTVTFPTAGTWFDYMSNTTYTTTGTAQTINLGPGEYRVFVNRNVNNVTLTPIINVPTSGNVLEAKVFPNPARGIFSLEMYVPESGTTRIELLNTVGQSAGLLSEAFRTRGKHFITLNKTLLNTPAGHYYLKITNKGNTKIVQLSLQ